MYPIEVKIGQSKNVVIPNEAKTYYGSGMTEMA